MLKVLIPALFLSFTPPVSADIVGDAWGILIDPFKLGAGSENLVEAVKGARDAISALDALQDDTDADVRFYLTDIDRKLSRIESDTNELVDHVADEILNIEKTVVRDVRLAIREFECAFIRVLDDALNQSLRDVLPSIAEGQTRYVRMPYGTQRGYKLGFIPWGNEPKVLEIDLSSGPSPFQVFQEIEMGYLESLEEADDQDSVILLLATYGNLAALAKKTACFYEGAHFEELLVQKYIYYNARVYPWITTINVRG